MSSHPWPLYDLVIRTPRIELRLPTEDELLALIPVIDSGVHPPDEMPFSNAWTRIESPQRERNMLQWHWSQRASWKPERWTLLLAVFVDGIPVGAQDIGARGFAIRRGVSSGSWVGQQWQGDGIGTEMREAVLHLAFAGLDAQFAASDYFVDNAASARVSAKAGYRLNGIDYWESEGVRRCIQRVIIEREEWQQRRRSDIELDGLEPCLELFGAR